MSLHRIEHRLGPLHRRVVGGRLMVVRRLPVLRRHRLLRLILHVLLLLLKLLGADCILLLLALAVPSILDEEVNDASDEDAEEDGNDDDLADDLGDAHDVDLSQVLSRVGRVQMALKDVYMDLMIKMADVRRGSELCLCSELEMHPLGRGHWLYLLSLESPPTSIVRQSYSGGLAGMALESANEIAC
ncbi:uncharacterized protein BO95DRAFT_164057 [Aspergillus brunneoviolaceus CBS 621.78]|uniref:Uncharacterized protein n=1 Tax=Aspergillus brunneoviolaceus CBS 621.78 TaxID=1450534 RepID=A0ACD1G788_9EURO|nr:hypothetical protein BO95DRAFT_164057 [Aspergillus brunneoviolaceus CBS 621.78]RAH44986.1 hypothetical protein BO95DRAFT_164057 [Aspergillus brunneoviolaceus CBS 621.78]